MNYKIRPIRHTEIPLLVVSDDSEEAIMQCILNDIKKEQGSITASLNPENRCSD